MTMVTRQTSIDAYRIIEAEGLLSNRRWEVYSTLFQKGPITATQIADQMPGYKSPSVGYNVHARLCEMREMGCVQEVGETSCPLTKMRVILWDVTDRIPTKLEKGTKKTKDQIILELKERIRELEGEILRSQNLMPTEQMELV